MLESQKQNQPMITLAKEMSQVLADGEFPIGAKIKKMAFGVAPSALKPALATEVRQATRDWPSYRPASEAVFTMPRATPSIVKKRRLAGPGIWETLLGSIKKDWQWWLGGSMALILVVGVIIASSGGRKE